MLNGQLHEDNLLRYTTTLGVAEASLDITFLDEHQRKVSIIHFKSIPREHLYELIKNKQPVNLKQAYIKDFSLNEYRKLNNLPDEEPVTLINFTSTNCFFDCESATDFSYAVFEGEDTLFNHTVFGNGYTNFSYANFGHGNVSFKRVKFGSGGTNFQSVKFGDGDITFEGTNFGNGNLSFADANFSNGHVHFKNTIFGNGNIDFKFAKFAEGDISFERAVFGVGKKDFKKVEFGGGKIDFRRVMFNDGDVLFEGVEFGNGKVNFRGTVFGKGYIGFEHADFANGEAIFDHVDFGLGHLSFNQAIAAHISFRSCPFNSYVDLRFKDCKIANLSNAIIRDILDIKPERDHVHIRELNLTDTRILGRIFLNWRENNVFGLIYEQKKSSYFQKAEQFRILKENFRVNGQYEDEDAAYIEFKRCEAKAMLNQELQNSLSQKLLAYPKYYFQKYVFDFIGRYATAPTRVLFNTLITVFVFGFIYYLFTIYFSSFGSIESTLPGNLNHFQEFWNSIYYSAITFFTIGYGDYFPHGALKIVAAFEGFSGVFLMSYFTVAFVRKILR